jgi:xylulose-5-phosphate/fructose-6-phosphate phosphoketolase
VHTPSLGWRDARQAKYRVLSFSTGYTEKGNIDTPLELAIRNQTDRFSLAIEAIDNMPHLGNKGSAARQALLNEQIDARNEAFETGMDPVKLTDWRWSQHMAEGSGDRLATK